MPAELILTVTISLGFLIMQVVWFLASLRTTRANEETVELLRDVLVELRRGPR